MKTSEYLIDLRRNHNINISLQNDELKIRASQKALSKEIAEGIKARKEEIIGFLKATNQNGTSNVLPLAAKKEHYKSSSAQKRLYFIQEFDKTSVAYNLPMITKLVGELDQKRLKESFELLIGRHESLRTSFKVVGEEVFQKISDQAVCHIEYFQKAEKDVQAIIDKFVRPFDLGKGPLLRVGLIQVTQQEHILMVDMHHIISDGISQAVLIKDFMALYNNDQLPELTFQYKDYAEWQQSEAQQKAMVKYRDFWLDEFSEEPVMLDLPTDFVRPPIKNYDGGSIHFEIGQEQTKILKGIAESEGTTLFTVLLSVYNILLSKLSNLEDIVIGTPVAGRQHPDLESILGMFVNTLPLRNYPRSKLSFTDFLLGVKARVLACFDHQSVHYEDLISELNLERDTSRNPLFDVMFAVHNFEAASLEIPGLKLESFNRDRIESRFDLSLTAKEFDGGIYLDFVYSTHLFKEETIKRFISYFEKIVSAVIEERDKKIGAIEVLTASEKAQLLDDLNNSRVSYPEDKTVTALFKEQVQRNPNKVALTFDNERLTYAELDRRTDQLAALLQARGMESNAIVGLMIGRSTEMLVGMLSILKAGGAYLPIDIDYPQERIHYMIEDSGMDMLLTTSELKGTLSYELEVVCVEEASEASPVTDTLSHTGSPSDLCYILYTSGTTGKPKGVMIQHRAVLNLVHAQQANFELGADECILQFSTFVFDASAEQIWLALLTGSTLVLIDKEKIEDNYKFNNYLIDQRVTHLHATPSFLEGLELSGVNSLKRVVAGGEACSPLLAEKFSKQYAFYNKYGLTETTVTSIMYAVTGSVAALNKIPIGRPVSNTKAYVMSASAELLPWGVAGELYLGGDGLALGYLNNQALTDERFIPNSYAPGELMYKTGDLVRWLPDGNLDYLGRADTQVKIRGYRIELGEIETHLASHQQVKEAAVLAGEREGNKYLVAYYVSEGPLGSALLRDYLSEKLPGYMVPSYFVHLSALPLTLNGKLDRRSLPAPEIKASEDHVAPQTDEEQLLAEVWSAVLGVGGIGVTDNFFAVGGDSIKSIQISSRMRNAGYEVSVQDIFAHQTIRQLAPKLKALVALIDQSTIEGTAPLSPIQRWLFEGPTKDTHHYNQSVMLNFPEGLSAEEVRGVFQYLQTHHDALRMVFRKDNEQWSQVNKRTEPPVSIEERNFSNLKDPSEELSTVSNQIQSGIDLVNGPLMKLGLFHLKDGSRLLIVIHHLIVDGMSWRILFEDIESLYQQLKNNEPLSLPLKTDSFLSWPSKLQEYGQTKAFEKARQYWEDFRGQQFAAIERDHPSGKSRNKDIEQVSFELGKVETSQLLTEVHSAFHTQINDILLAALLLGIKKQHGHTAVTVDLEGHGREPIHPDVNVGRTVGWFTSIYPVLLSREGEGLTDIIKQVKEGLRRVPNHGIDYLLYKYLDNEIPQTEHRSQIAFNYLGQFDTDTEGRSFVISDDPQGFSRSQNDLVEYDWNISGMVRHGQLEMALSYGKEQYNQETIHSFMGHYEESLREVIDYCRSYDKTELTPSDLTYQELSIAQLDELQQRYAIEDIYPLSPMQEGMLFHSLMDSESAQYFEQMTFDLEGALDINAVEHCINALMERYDVFRTIFLYKGYLRPLQVVLKGRKADFSYRDLRDEPHATKEKLVESYRQEDASRKFDLSEDVLIRLTVLQISDTEHTLIWSNHHVLMDGWCMSIIFSEFRALYSSQTLGHSTSLPPVKKYSSFITWLEGQDQSAALDYWREYLADYGSLATIPTSDSWSSSGVNAFAQKSEELTIDKVQVVSLNTVSESYGVTLNTIIQTAWAILLNKYNDTNDVVFGSVVSGRPPQVEDVENMVGLFINTIPVRVNFESEDTIGALLKEVQQRGMESEPHHYSPLAQVQSLSDLGRGLLDHILIIENYPIDEQIAEGAGTEDSADFSVMAAQAYAQTSYDLTLVVLPGEEIRINFNYNHNKYEEETVRQVKTHLQSIIGQIIDSCAGTGHQDAKVSAIDMLTASEKVQLLSDFNKSEASYPQDKTITALFKEQVQLNPNNVAVTFNNERLTYAELDERTDQLAALLQARGMESNAIVGLLIGRSTEMLIGMLSILKAGGAYLPMDIDYPEERIRYMIEDSGMDMLLTTSELKDTLSYELELVCVEEASEASAMGFLSHAGSSSDLCYVLYTSGTTGKPKGVMIRHSGVVNLIYSQRATLQIGSGECFLLFSPIVFDSSVEQICLALLTGNTVVLIDKEKLGDSYKFNNYLINHKVTHIIATPSFLEGLEFSGANSLKRLIAGGEVCSPLLAEKLSKQCTFYNQYGPTETTITSTIYVPTGSVGALNKIPIGRPVGNTGAYVLSASNELLPLGAAGELYLGGDGLALGYFNNQALTDERFIPNPHSPGELMYKTGDLVRWLPDGNLDYLGRIDDQVKIRGHRIELGEIETQLAAHSQVKEAAVLAREGDKYKFLVAYYVSGEALDISDLRSHLSDRLPDYMVPSYFVQLDALPLTTNGKLDRKSLPAPEIKAGEDHVAPQTKEEQLLAEVWSAVLVVEGIGVTDNFFAVGGDSIKSIQISSRVRNAGYEVTVQDVFAHQTIRQLAPKLKVLVALSDQSTVEGTASLSPIQRWLFDGPTKDKHHYNQSVMLNFPEGLSAEEVRVVFEHLQTHHDVLRVVFRQEQDVWSQVNMGTTLPVSLEERDLREANDTSKELSKVSNQIQSSIDMANGPLMKLGLFHMKDGSRLLIVIHHLIVDGVSWRILFEDVESLYQQLKNNEPLSLPLKTDSFLSWPSKLQEYSEGSTFQKARQFWGDFDHQELVPIERDHPSAKSKNKDIEQVSFELGKVETTQLLTEVHSAFHTQINDILLATLLLGIKKQYGHHAVTVDLEGHGREPIHPDVNVGRTVGWFTSIYPVLLSCEEEGLADIIKQVKEYLRSVPNHGIDYLLYTYLDHETPQTEHRSQIAFNYLGQFDSDTEGRSFAISNDPQGLTRSQNDVVEYDWNISGMVRHGQLEMALMYGKEQYNEQTIHSFMRHYEESLREVINYCRSCDKTALTPSDLTYKELSIAQLDELQQRHAIEDIYPLSPVQEGMLYHSLVNIEAGDYFGQTTYQLQGNLDIKVVEDSMNELMARYAILRTIFLHEGYARPIQVVLKERKIDFNFKDLRNTSLNESKQATVQAYREEEKSKSFNLSTDVLMRLLVLQTGDNEFELIWSHHHVLMDGWCIGILVSEFTQVYTRTLQNKSAFLQPTTPYSTYIQWLENRPKEASETYWRNYLSDFQAPATLPQREASLSEGLPYLLKRQRAALDSKETQGLDEFSRKHGVTVNTIFQCAWGLLLAKYNNVNDVVFGSVVSGRPVEIEGIETMIGLFINTIPTRINYEPEDTVIDLLRKAQARIVSGGPHHYFPLSEIQALSEQGGDLIDHIIAFENFPVTKQLVNPDANPEEEEMPFEINNSEYWLQTNYDLSITVLPNDEFEVVFDYNNNTYEDETIANVLSSLKNIISSFVQQYDKPLRELSLFNDQQLEDIHESFAKELEVDVNQPTIQERLNKSFRENRHSTAIEYKGEIYDYATLELAANKIARAIGAHQLPAESNIGILCEDRYWLIGAMLGILKSRMAFVPLETGLPENRLSSMIDQTCTKLIITDQDVNTREKLAASNDSLQWLTLDEINKQSDEAFEPETSYLPEDHIYVYFTSGSTGNPKGVIGKNKGLSHFIDWEINAFNIDTSFRISQFTNPGFDVFMRDIFVPLCAGGTICIPEENILSMDEGIHNWIAQQRINLIHCVPSLFKLIQKAGLNEGSFPDLKYILLAGEKILPWELKDWYKIFDRQINLVNIYGPTETTLAKGSYVIQPEDANRSFMPLKAIPGARFLILDEGLNFCPKGAIGEIYIRTPYRSAGYLGLPEKNKDSFVLNPFSIDQNDVIYKTGDVGREHENGEIEILGRVDNQIKIRGIRIELDDIKENLCKYPGITDAVVAVKEDDEAEKFIAAYIVSESPFDATDLRAFLDAALPPNMVPSYLIQIPEFPLMPNGKINRKALPEPEIQVNENHEEASNEIEGKLLDIWSEVLKVDKELISTTKTFFEMGGHSIKVFHIINRIQQEFSVKLKLGEIFKNASVRETAKLISDQRPEVETQIPTAAQREFYVASPAQERMYYQHLLHEKNTAFNISIPIQIKGKVDVDKLNGSFQKLVDRHEALRTNFALSDDGVIQRIHEEVRFEIEVLGSDQGHDVKESFNAFVRPFDLSGDSLMRCGILSNESGSYLFVDIHHIVCDGSSLEILINDFKKIHFGEALKPLNRRYVDYACWLIENKEKLHQQKTFWSEKLSGELPRTDLPMSQERDEVDTKIVDFKELEVSDEVYNDIKRISTTYKVSDYMLLLSAYYILLHKMSGDSDLIIGTEVLGRTQSELKDIVGTFVNVLPLRVEAMPEKPYYDFLNEVKECVLEAFDNQDFQFDEMVSLVDKDDEDLSRNPIFDFYFSLSNTVDSSAELDELKFVPVAVDKRVKGEYEFAINVAEHNKKMTISFIYSSELYDGETIELLMDYFQNILTDILKNQSLSIEGINMEKVLDQMTS